LSAGNQGDERTTPARKRRDRKSHRATKEIMTTKKKRGRRRKAADLGYVHARELVGRSLLVLGLRPLGQPHPYFRCAVDARLPTGQRLHFPAGKVVEQQIRETPVLPVWTRLLWQEGYPHSYYLLELAQTIDWKRIKSKRGKSKQPKEGNL
jgi:hypothetical protein